MCGIVGLVGDFRDPEVETLKLLLFLDTIRGEQSTGVASVSPYAKKDICEVFKEPVAGYDFIEYTQLRSYVNPAKIAIIGHNRAATRGSVKKANAHPFKHGHITGVHNGTLNMGYAEHLIENVPYASFEVDSEHVFYALSKNPDVADVIARTHGDFAFVWYNEKEHTINFIRNNGRPLFYRFSTDGKNMFFLSSPMMLNVAMMEVRGISTLDYEEKYHLFEENTLYTMKLPSSFGKKLPDFTKTKLNPGTIRKAIKLIPRQPKPMGNNIIEFDYRKHIPNKNQHNYSGPKASHTTPNPNVLSDKDRAEISASLWADYSDRSKARWNYSKYIKNLKALAVSYHRNKIVEQFEKYKAIDDKLTEMFVECPLINGFKEYEPSETKEMLRLMQQIDYIRDLMTVWRHERPKAFVGAILKDAEKKGIFNESVFHSKTSNDFPHATIFSEEELVRDIKLDAPSGLGNLTNRDFKKLIRAQGCSHCSDQNIDWEPTDCVLTVNRELICPDCTTTENVQDMLAKGLIKRA